VINEKDTEIIRIALSNYKVENSQTENVNNN